MWSEGLDSNYSNTTHCFIKMMKLAPGEFFVRKNKHSITILSVYDLLLCLDCPPKTRYSDIYIYFHLKINFGFKNLNEYIEGYLKLQL